MMEMNQIGLSVLDVCGHLRKACRVAGGQKAWADLHGVTPAYVSAVLTARKQPSDAILKALGLRKLVRYVPVRPSC